MITTRVTVRCDYRFRGDSERFPGDQCNETKDFEVSLYGRKLEKAYLDLESVNRDGWWFGHKRDPSFDSKELFCACPEHAGEFY